jgi:hypothetical protein
MAEALTARRNREKEQAVSFSSEGARDEKDKQR